MIYCTKCGQQNADDARGCFNCGQPFTGQGGSTPFTTPPPPQQQQAGNPWGSAPQGSPMQPRPGGGLLSIGMTREPIMVLVFMFITCGIYGIWWFFTMMTEIKDSLGRDDLNPLMEFVLSIVTCGVYGIYAFYYKYPKLMVDMQQRAGMPINDISTLTLVFAIVFSPVSIFMIQDQLNKIWIAAGQR